MELRASPARVAQPTEALRRVLGSPLTRNLTATCTFCYAFLEPIYDMIRLLFYASLCITIYL
jgi:hypothetical protein